MDTILLTSVVGPETRSTKEYWQARVRERGVLGSIFLTSTPNEIAAFTKRHLSLINQYATQKDVLEIGCGWGRMAAAIDSVAASYVGLDFVPELIDAAQRMHDGMVFDTADVRKMPYDDEMFDLVIGVTALSSIAVHFEESLKEIRRVLRPDGVALFLEETFFRCDFK